MFFFILNTFSVLPNLRFNEIINDFYGNNIFRYKRCSYEYLKIWSEIILIRGVIKMGTRLLLLILNFTCYTFFSQSCLSIPSNFF